MAFLDPAAAAAAPIVTSALAVSFARRVRGWRQRFMVALLGLSLINLVVVGVLGTVTALSGVALPVVLAVPLSVVAILCGVASVSFHLPSLIVLGVDEVLERHGVLVTTLGQIADLLIFAGIFAVVTYPWGGHDENGPT
jgi:hypothetical protein